MFIKKNDQEKIKTIFYTKFQIIKEYWFKINSTLKEIFDYFEKHIKEEGFRLKSNYNLFDNDINETYTIEELIKNEKNDSIISGEIWIEVDEEILFDDENDDIFYTILHPKLNPFELIEYNTLNSKIRIIQCPKDILFACELNQFSKESAFCNSINALYLSGGEMSGKTINNFWIINKNNYKINKKIMPINKKYHSMLYIPDNFILIAGGDTLNSIIYDIENKDFIKWANMNKKHFQPGLFIYGDYVYAFSALSDINRNNKYFERTNLTSKIAKWEKIYPKYDEKAIIFNSHFFGVSKYLEGNILFVGGEKYNPNYLYNPMDNTITISNGEHLSIPFWDKSFYKISKKYNICIPLNFNNTNKLTFLNKETESLEEVICDKNTGYVNLENENEEEEGNIYIQSITNNIKNKQNINLQIGICPKNLMKKRKDENSNNNKNNNNNIDINFNEERIIVDTCYDCYDNTNNIDNSNHIKSNKNYTKKSYLYITDSIIDEQIINREVDLAGKQNIGNDNNSNDKDINEDIKKEEYIFIRDLNGVNPNENENNTPLIKNEQKQFLYIPKSVINDQVINRELTFNKNDDNINNENENKTNSENKNNFIDELIPEIKINNEDEIIIEGKMDNNEDIVKENSEDKIIINYGNENLDENNENIIKLNQDNKYLYIPNSLIDDHTINRKVEMNENIIENKKSLKKKENSRPYIKKKIIETKRNSTISSNNSEIKNNLNLEHEILKEMTYNNLNTDGNQKPVKKYRNGIKIYIPKTIEGQIMCRDIITNSQNTI